MSGLKGDGLENKVSGGKFFRNTFLAGIVAMLPLVTTLYVLKLLYSMIVSNLMPVINRIMGKHVIIPDTFMGIFTVIVFIACIFCVGLLIKVYVGRAAFNLLEKTMARIPLVRSVYNIIKQMIDSIGSSKNNFEKVVLVDYPKEGSYCIGFVVRNTQSVLEESAGKGRCYNVFVPTAPNPTSGFILIIPVENCIEIPLTVDEGIKYILSVGLINFNSKEKAMSALNGKR